ncbi:MAG: hypothetical protein WEA54_01750 [Actinomycetota bacterium]
MPTHPHTPRARPARGLAATVSAALVVGLLIGPVATVGAAPSAETGDATAPGPCALGRGSNEDVRSFSKRLIRCAVAHWPVRGGVDKALCIAKRESGLIPRAVSADGRYLGLYQHAKRYWPSRYDATTQPDWRLENDALNGRTAAIVTMRMVHRGGRHGWDPWRGRGCAIG